MTILYCGYETVKDCDPNPLVPRSPSVSRIKPKPQPKAPSGRELAPQVTEGECGTMNPG